MTASIWAPNGFSPETVPYSLFEFTAIANQTTFSVAPFTGIAASQIKVYTGISDKGQVNRTSQYTISGSDIILAPQAAGTYVRVEVFRASIDPDYIVLNIPAPELGKFLTNNGSILQWGTPTADAGSVAFNYPTAYPAGSIGKWLKDLLLPAGSGFIGWQQSGAGASLREVSSKLKEVQLNLNDFGADPTGAVTSDAAWAAAVAACPIGGTLRLNGTYKFNDRVLVTKTMTIEGVDSRTANVTSSVNSKSFLYFQNDTNGIVFDGPAVVTLRNMIISGIGPTSTYYGIDVSDNISNALILDQCVVQNFELGVNLYQTYYSKIHGGAIVHCKNALRLDNCYNTDIIATMIRPAGTGSTGITALNGSHFNVIGGSVESFLEYGVGLFGGSMATLHGTYFEGVGGGTGWSVYLTQYAQVNAFGCLVYLSAGCRRWISIDSGTTERTHVESHNNRIMYPTDDTFVQVYTLNSADPYSYSNISGDSWINFGITPGVNCSYINPEFFSGAGPAYGVGQHRILHPTSHPNANLPIDTTAFSCKTSYVVPFGANVVPDFALGDRQIINATSAAAFNIDAPRSTPTYGGEREFTITIVNATGGALGVATWNAQYKMAAWVQPAAGKSRSITFRWTGSVLVEVSRTPADIPT